MAWARQKRRAIEGASIIRVQRGRFVALLLHRYLLRKPQQRAVFHFISQTIQRDSRYQVYLALYSGAGCALALVSVVAVRSSSATSLILGLSNPGLHAVLPLLLFWLVAGLKVAFGLPVNMAARWVFPMNLINAGAYARAVKAWVLLGCGLLIGCVLSILLALGWSAKDLLLQAIWGAALSMLLADVFFFQGGKIPFTQPRLPARANLPITLTLYAAAFPAFVLSAVYCELLAEPRLSILFRAVASIGALHLLSRLRDRFTQPSTLSGFSLEEEDDSFQTLGLFSD